MANVIARPEFRAHEIEVLGRSSSENAKKIPLSDLCLRLEGDKLVLYSWSLDREVKPRISNAHRLSHGLNLYRFLGQLQSQDGAGLGFGYGDSLTQLCRRLPRLRHGRVVLALAQWRVDKHEIESLNRGDGKTRFHTARQWRNSRKMPRFVALADSDNRLLIDFDNPLSVDAFAHLVRRRPNCTLEEATLRPEHLCVEGEEGSYTHEVIVPFSRKKPLVSAVTRPLRAGQTSVEQTFLPGSEGLYLKLYGSSRSLDLFLSELRPALRRWRDQGTIQSWFFLRYADPDLHLRLRLQGEPAVLMSRVLPALSAAMKELANRAILRSLAVDTYKRETDRYGGPRGIELAEHIFAADSESVMDMVCRLDGDEGHEARWKLCFRGIDQLLDDFHYSLAKRRDLMATLRDSFRAEFGADVALLKGIGKRYRSEAPDLRQLLNRKHDSSSWLKPGLDALSKRSRLIRPSAAKLIQYAQKKELTVPLGSLVASLLHMHVNRLIASDARAHELVLYDLLFRTYDGVLARQRVTKKRKAAEEATPTEDPATLHAPRAAEIAW